MRTHSTAGAPDEALYCCAGCRLASSLLRSKGPDAQTEWTTTVFGLGVFFALATMMVSLVLWGELVGPAGASAQMSPLESLLRYGAWLTATPAMLILGLPLATGMRRGGRLWPADALIFAGALAAYLYSVWATVGAGGRVYFDAATVTLLLVNGGRLLEARARSRAQRSLDALSDLAPETAWVRREGSFVTVPIEEVRLGDRVRIRPGERIPADGTVIRGESALDRSALSGETEPQRVRVASLVHAGALALDGVLEIRVTASAGERLVDQVALALRDARRDPGPTLLVADRAALLFLPIVGVAAIAGLIAGLLHAGPLEGVLRVLTVAVVACPCAFGLAAPLAMYKGLRAAFRAGVLLRGGSVLERLATVRTVLFDKTGTLARIGPRVVSIHTDATLSEHEALSLAAALAANSRHPASQAIVEIARARGVATRPAHAVTERPGLGLRGVVGDSVAVLGGRRWLEEQRIVSGDLEAAQGVLLAVDGVERAAFVLDEELRPGALEAVEGLRRMGLAVEIVSGDDGARVAAFANRLGVSGRGGLDPIDKLEALREAQASGPVALVGDGINDAPALGAADVGIAVGDSADLARGAAGVTVLNDDLSTLCELFRVARRARKAARASLWWACGYNTVLMALSVAGWMHPCLGAIAMVLSSITIVAICSTVDRTATEASPRTEPEAGTTLTLSSGRAS